MKTKWRKIEDRIYQGGDLFELFFTVGGFVGLAAILVRALIDLIIILNK
jgi:hypothetical protein